MRLRHSFAVPTLVSVICSVPSLLSAWGFNAHVAINREVAMMLPEELGDYLRNEIEFISEHAVDPDLWREDTVKHRHEGRGHYIDSDLYGDYPFSNIPRSWETLLATYGEEKIDKWGTGPWRIEQAAVRVASFWYSAWIMAGRPNPH